MSNLFTVTFSTKMPKSTFMLTWSLSEPYVLDFEGSILNRIKMLQIEQKSFRFLLFVLLSSELLVRFPK